MALLGVPNIVHLIREREFAKKASEGMHQIEVLFEILFVAFYWKIANMADSTYTFVHGKGALLRHGCSGC